MNPRQLLEAGKVRDAASSLAALLRENPSDQPSRTFLFDLLCFSGQYDRAEKQLAILATASHEAEMGAVLYYSALHAEKLRHEMFQNQKFPTAPAPKSAPGVLNGKAFETITDLDPEIGPRLEVYAAGAYLWIP